MVTYIIGKAYDKKIFFIFSTENLLSYFINLSTSAQTETCIIRFLSSHFEYQHLNRYLYKTLLILSTSAQTDLILV